MKRRLFHMFAGLSKQAAVNLEHVEENPALRAGAERCLQFQNRALYLAATLAPRPPTVPNSEQPPRLLDVDVDPWEVSPDNKLFPSS